jgi:hypothetical protein
MAKDKKAASGRRVTRAGKTTAASEKMQMGMRRQLLSRRTLLIALVAVGTVVIVGGLLGIYYKVYASPEHVFRDMINNNLATSGVTKEIIKGQASGNNDETTQTVFTPDIIVRDIRRIDLPATKTKVTIETIGTTSTDYQHYLKVDRRGGNGKPLNYSSIYNLWIKNEDSTGGQAQLVNSAFFGATLFGNLDAANRATISNQLMSAYKVNYDSVRKSSRSSRKLYTYDVTVMMRQYAASAHTYAATLGLPIAAQINPNLYSKNAQLHVVMTVDVLSRQLKIVKYLNQGVTESYSGYGAAPEIRLPAKTVPASELTQALGAIK